MLDGTRRWWLRRSWATRVLLLIALPIGFLAFGFYFGWFTLPEISTNESLVVVTFLYMILTGFLVLETRLSRKQEILPVVNLNVEPYAIGARGAQIENIGNGPAKNVDATIKFEPDGPKGQIQSKNVRAGGFIGSEEPEISDKNLEEYDQLVVSGYWTNIWGGRTHFKDSVKTQSVGEYDIADSLMSEDDELRYLDKIETQLKNISNELEMNKLDTYLTLRNRETVLSVLKENEGLTLQEISEETGLHEDELAITLASLSEANAIEIPSEGGDSLLDIPEEAEIKPANS